VFRLVTACKIERVWLVGAGEGRDEPWTDEGPHRPAETTGKATAILLIDHTAFRLVCRIRRYFFGSRYDFSAYAGFYPVMDLAQNQPF